jgi:type II secretory pathway pseudopilin PulG
MNHPHARTTSTAAPSRRPAAGFTIAELLIVISIIVLVLAMAVPAFNAITGNKSEAAMFNTLSAMLARARTEAVGVQQLRGVMFYFDPSDTTYKVALVRQVDPPTPIPPLTTPAPMDNIDVYLDLTSDADVLTLPAGIGVQTIDDNSANGVAGYDDRYIGYNTKGMHLAMPMTDTYVQYGGVILFDGRGQLVCKSYAFQTHKKNSTTGVDSYTAMGRLLWNDGSINPPNDVPDANHDDIAPVNPQLTPGGRPLYLRSQIGVAVYSLEAFAAVANSTPDDAQVVNPGAGNANELAEENWLDENAQLSLINRYNGSLLKGE